MFKRQPSQNRVPLKQHKLRGRNEELSPLKLKMDWGSNFDTVTHHDHSCWEVANEASTTTILSSNPGRKQSFDPGEKLECGLHWIRSPMRKMRLNVAIVIQYYDFNWAIFEWRFQSLDKNQTQIIKMRFSFKYLPTANQNCTKHRTKSLKRKRQIKKRDNLTPRLLYLSTSSLKIG